MNACLLLMALTCGTVGLPDGSVIALQHSKAVVERYTNSEITHVAVVLNRGGQSWVYEAAPSRVTRVRLDDYFQHLAAWKQRRKEQLRVCVLRPLQPYSDQQVAQMQQYLEGQVGRRYSLKGYLRGKPGEGIHCAEMTAGALEQTGRMQFERGHRESPASLVEKLQPWYDGPQQVALQATSPRPPWYSRLWKDWRSFRTWCVWSCYETWNFCW